MAKKEKLELHLPTLDDLFTTQAERDNDDEVIVVKKIPLTELDPFPGNPYGVRDDEDMFQLMESIHDRGVVVPAVVRQKDDDRFEIISGHRRKRASELLGLKDLRCQVVKMTDDEATFTYENGLLKTVSNDDGSKIVCGYDSSASCIPDRSRVKSITEHGASAGYTAQEGNTVDFAYNEDNTTTFTYTANYIDSSNPDDKKISEVASFDSFGRTTCIVNLEDYSATDLSYTTVSEAQKSNDKYGSANKIAHVTQTGATVHNLLMDSSFENATCGWSTNASSDSTAYIGHKIRKLTQSGYVSQTVSSLDEGEYYTVSGYFKSTGTGGDKIKFASSASNTSDELTLVGSDWQRFSYTFTAGTSADIRITSVSGSVYVDCVQLEKGEVANHYNLLSNSNFRLGSGTSITGWDTEYIGSTGGDGLQGDGTVKITGKNSEQKLIRQYVQINKPAEETAIVVSAKVKANSAPLKDDRLLNIDARFFYDDGTEELVQASFNYDTDSNTAPQYASAIFMPSKSHKEDKVVQVRYMLCFEYNVGTAHFSDAQMFLDETSVAYTYDDDGNVISAVQN